MNLLTKLVGSGSISKFQNNEFAFFFHRLENLVKIKRVKIGGKHHKFVYFQGFDEFFPSNQKFAYFQDFDEFFHLTSIFPVNSHPKSLCSIFIDRKNLVKTKWGKKRISLFQVGINNQCLL